MGNRKKNQGSQISSGNQMNVIQEQRPDGIQTHTTKNIR